MTPDTIDPAATMGNEGKLATWHVHPLYGCQAKLARALELIDEIKLAVDTWLAEQGEVGYELVPDETGRSWLMLMPDISQPPIRMGALFSDALHNLRSCLDHLVVNLILGNGADPGKAQFPYSETKKEWDEAVARRNLGRMDPESLEVIRMHQPFAGNKELSVLRVLSNADKHNYFFPISLGFGPNAEPPKMTGADGGEVLIQRLFEFMTPIRCGQPLYRVVVETGRFGLEIHPAKFRMRIGFGYAEGLLGPDLGTLRDLVILVSRLVGSFSAPSPGYH